MELDEPSNVPHEDWDRMETEDELGRTDKGGPKRSTAPGGGSGDQDSMMGALRYAQELRHEYKNDRSPEVANALHEIFALFAYEDPRNSPLMRLMDPSGRVPVAEELNSAILGACFVPVSRPVAHVD